jgi:hypothetical protein
MGRLLPSEPAHPKFRQYLTGAWFPEVKELAVLGRVDLPEKAQQAEQTIDFARPLRQNLNGGARWYEEC